MLKMRKGVENKGDEIGDNVNATAALPRGGDLINQSHLVTTTQNTNEEPLKPKSYE